MVNVSVIKILYSALIFMKCKRSVDLVVESSNKFVLLRNSSIFIDKTVLLKKIFQYDFLLITAPHKFGKTTNLHMIKLFLGNGNTKTVIADVFRNTNIWRDREFIVKHVGNYPIIHYSMKAKSVIQTFDDLYKQLKDAVSEAFLEHKYLVKSTKLGTATKKRYIEYCKSQVNDYEVSLKFLSKVLHMHHGKRVTVLIDDFDYALTYSIFKKELDSSKTAGLLFRLIDNTINLNEYVGKSVVMGCVPFKLGAQYSGLYLLEHFKFMITKDFTPYFGFTQRETEKLLDKFQLGRFKKDISNWYGGYTYLYSDFQIYNPWSVLMFLKHKKLDIYWVPRSSQRMLYSYLEPSYELKEHITNLVKKKNVTIKAVSSFTSYEVDKLKSVQFASYSYAEDYTEDHLFLQLLLESGYLTYAQKYRDVPISTAIKIPNLEIQKVFEQILLRLAAVYPDINRKYRGARPTRYYKPHREPVQSPQQEPRRRPYSNHYRDRSRWQQQEQYSESEPFINQHATRRASYPYKAVRPTYSKYTEGRSQFRHKLYTKLESGKLQDSSDNSMKYRRPVQTPHRSNTLHNRQHWANKERPSQVYESQSDSFISSSRMYTNKATKNPPNKYHTQPHDSQRQVLSSESQDSESGSFFANYRAHLRAGKIKRTPDLIFNPQHKVEGQSSSLDLQESMSDSFTYNYKTFEEAERLRDSVTILPARQSITHKNSDPIKSQFLQSDLISHHYKTNNEITKSKNIITSSKQSNRQKYSLSMESQSDLSSSCYQIHKYTSQPKGSLVSNTHLSNLTLSNQHLKWPQSIESQGLKRGVSSTSYEASKEDTQLKNTLSESFSKTKESVSIESQDLKSSSLIYDSKSYKDEDDSLSISSVQMYTTKVTQSPNSFINLFAHQPSINSLMILTTHLPKTSSSHYTNSKMELTIPVHSTIKSQAISSRGSHTSSTTLPTVHQSIIESTKIHFRAENHTNSYYNNTAKPLLLS